METSDSEYFESADEDFGSDYEDRQKSHRNPIVAHKIPESDLCKLTLNSDKTRETFNETEKRDKHKVNKHINTEKNNKIDEKTCSDIGDNYLKTLDNSKDEEKGKEFRHGKSISSKKTLEKSCREPNQETIQSDSDEHNLWDDDELDWGSEAAKEAQITEHSLLSKNDDSGWDDFDAEWESSSPSNEINQTLTTEQLQSTNNSKNIVGSLDDQWHLLENSKEKVTSNESGWGGWGGWGVTSILNTATQSVSSLTNHVSQGLSTVLENGMGIPEPEEMARINKVHLDKENSLAHSNSHHTHIQDNPGGFGLGNFVSGVSQLTKFVESTSSKVITGGLDTLEAIGKKTVEVLQEGDPGLKKKRAFLKLDNGKPNLSQTLREAKEKAEEENEELVRRHIEVKRAKNYEAFFDDHQGLVHLEALEMLSKLCNIKIDNLNNSLTGNALKDMRETLDQVKELCELTDEDEEKITIDQSKEIITNAVSEINIPISYVKLFEVCNETDTWLKNLNFNFIDAVELHQQALDTLAQLTALSVEQFHKTAELLLVKEHRSTADEADSLVQITTTLKSLIITEATKFTNKLNMIENLEQGQISEHITNIFYEAANSGTYIQDAFQLLIPILQVGAVDSS